MNRSAKFVVVVLLAVSNLGVLPGIAQASTTVRARANHSWSPGTASIAQNGKIVWKNPTSVSHTVTSTSSNWSKDVTLSAGSQTSFTFRHTGTFRYKCTIHAGMTGKIVVQ